MTRQTRKRFGQHWLRSEKILHQIITTAEISAGDRILEIGPGTGLLTRGLLRLADSVTAVELDRDLCALLRKTFQDAQNFRLIEGDILKIDLQDFAVGPDYQRPNKVVANIPYYITGPILERLLGTIAHPNPSPFEQIVLLVQHEVALRICAKPGSRAAGALSVRVQYLADCELVCKVPRTAFSPPPAVESAVVKLSPRRVHPAAVDPHRLDLLVKLGFAAKRKMLRNNLKSFIERDHLVQLLEQLEINPQVRAEDLSVAEWVSLSNHLAQTFLPPN